LFSTKIAACLEVFANMRSFWETAVTIWGIIVLNKDNLLSYLLVLFVGIIVGAGTITLTKGIQPAPIIIQPPAPTSLPAPTPTPGPLRVFVNGAVAAPAVYELAANAIVEQAIEQAGGFTLEADTAVVNLALPLQDGMQIYVPTTAETDVQVQPIINSPVVRSEGIELEAEGDTAVAAEGEVVNINKATVAELDTLPGIGPSTAEKIVEYRDSNGPFATIDEIMSVSGIGPAKFEQIQAFITTGE
jgi:competence protein ComEA